LIKKNNLGSYPAAGVIFLENAENGIKIHPCVTVPGISSYYETACGSGTIAVGLVQCFKSKASSNVKMSLIQPSNQVIKAIIEGENGRINNAVICGPIKTYQGERKFNISVPEILTVKDWSGFSKKEEVYTIYKDCFAEFPYEQDLGDIEETIADYCKNGKFLLAYDSGSNKTAAFAAAIPLEKDADVVDVLKKNNIDFDISCDWYYADIGTEKDFRGRRIGFVLCKELLEVLPATARKVFMRTMVINKASISLHEKIGFKIIDGSLHDSPLRKKKSGKMESDPSILLEYTK
jgi:ribosomal protein S18 acetylase RimI-like enzyme